MERRSIIVCDDELELANEIGEFFDSNGWRVLVCSSATHVRQVLAEGFVATCLLTDLRLGDGTGAELVEFARRLPSARRPKVIAMITGHAADASAGGNFGADLLYFKPVDPFVVLADVNSRIAASEKPVRTPTLGH